MQIWTTTKSWMHFLPCQTVNSMFPLGRTSKTNGTIATPVPPRTTQVVPAAVVFGIRRHWASKRSTLVTLKSQLVGAVVALFIQTTPNLFQILLFWNGRFPKILCFFGLLLSRPKMQDPVTFMPSLQLGVQFLRSFGCTARGLISSYRVQPGSIKSLRPYRYYYLIPHPSRVRIHRKGNSLI